MYISKSTMSQIIEDDIEEQDIIEEDDIEEQDIIEDDDNIEEDDDNIEEDSDGENMNISDIYQDEKLSKIEFCGQRKGLPRHFGMTPNTEYYDNVNQPSNFLNMSVTDIRKSAQTVFNFTQKIEKLCYNNAIYVHKSSRNGVLKKQHLETPEFKLCLVQILGQVVCDLEQHSYKDVITSLQNGLTGFSGISWNKDRFLDQLETGYIETPLNVKNGIHVCSKCKKNQTMFYQLQTRSADEPISTFISCCNCGFKWREG